MIFNKYLLLHTNVLLSDGIVEPISGGEVRDKQDQFRGVGHNADPFEAFRKSKAGSFYTRMKERDKERDHVRPRTTSKK